MNTVYDVLIIGAGAAGLYLAARLDMPKIALVEEGERVGKKLLATGNGKCNMFNVDMSPEYYNDPDGVRNIILSYGYEQFLASFGALGLTTKSVGGRIYPYSETATSVLDVFRRAIAKNSVDIRTNCAAVAIQKIDGIFKVDLSEKDSDKSSKDKTSWSYPVYAKRVVLATGTNASFGKDSSGLLKNFGHTCKKFVPSLAPILTEREKIKGLNGVRVKAELELCGKREAGEILFKDFGVSGIAAMNLSAELARGRAKTGDILHIDFAPDMDAVTLVSRLTLLANATADEAMTGLFHSKLKDRLMFASGVSRSDSATSSADRLARKIKDFALKTVGTADKSLAQVNSGGIPLAEFDEDLQSKYVENLYAVGEVLDVDGPCGGYNLGWAWASAERVAHAICGR